MNKILRPKSFIAALAVSAGFLGTQATVASASVAPTTPTVMPAPAAHGAPGTYCDPNYCYSTGGWGVSPILPAPALVPVVALAPVSPTTFCTPTFCFTY